MIRRTFVSFAALSGFVVLAFGSMGGMDDVFDEVAAEVERERAEREASAGGVATAGGASAEANVAACEAYKVHYDGLECIGELPEDFCKSFDNGYVDYSEYFSCMAAAAKCDGKMPDLTGMKDCSFQ